MAALIRLIPSREYVSHGQNVYSTINKVDYLYMIVIWLGECVI